ncbi:tyrosine-type recombinase/integrase [Streptomyces sp. NPDC059134]|uniref:tyrosine-type recombinase/integrase n=1 Tax=Streptomyces sp. NPDC059134 TaxID=3346738 RepID=UPI003688620B
MIPSDVVCRGPSRYPEDQFPYAHVPTAHANGPERGVTRHLEHFAAPGRDGHVFVGPQGGQLRRSTFRDDWGKARKAAGVTGELRFHELRHTGNTPASTAGAGTQKLMTRTGHSGSRAALICEGAAHERTPLMSCPFVLCLVSRFAKFSECCFLLLSRL